MRAETARFFPSRRRGMALIVSIAVLAILTLIVMALTASQTTERHLASLHQTKQSARELIRLGLDSALAQMRKNGPDLPKEDHSTDEGGFSISARPLDLEEGTAKKIYDGIILKYHPGDALLTVIAAVPGGPSKLAVEHNYLVNVTPGRERKVRVNERLYSVVMKR